MTSIILVESTGSLKQSKVKDITCDNLYKKCGFRVPDHFAKRTTWNVLINDDMVSIELWSKNEGKAGSENKYDFPPPIDKELYFGTCILIRIDEHDQIVNLTSDLWTKVYEHLFGGFEDIAEDEEPSEDELENVPASMKTKHGYLKDGFVVDALEDNDDDEENDDEDDDYDEDDEDEVIVERLAKPSGTKTAKSSKEEEEEEEDDLEGSELEEDEYEYSDDE